MNPYCRRAVAAGGRARARSTAARSASSRSDRRRPRTRCARRSPGGPTAASRPPGCCSPILRSPARTRWRPRGRSPRLIQREGPFDLVLAGRNSVDADTGQVGPELAELLDLPFATGVRHLSLDDRTLHLRCEHDDGWVQARVDLPVVLSTAERLIDPCKVEPEGRAAVPAERIRIRTAPTSATDRGVRPRARPASVACASSSPNGSGTSWPTHRSTSRCAARSRSWRSAARSIPRSITPPTSDWSPPPIPTRRARSACSSSRIGPPSPASCSARRRGSVVGSSRWSSNHRTRTRSARWGADEVVHLPRRRGRGGRRGRVHRAGCARWSRGRCSRRAPRGAARSRAAPRRSAVPVSPATRSGSSSTAIG